MKLINRFVHMFALISYILLANLAFAPVVRAGVLDTFFDDTLGGYSSTGLKKNETGWYSGNFEIAKRPTSNKNYAMVSLSITPPSFSIKEENCELSIDAFFGGLSFIANINISGLVQGLLQGGLMFILHLALKKFCPQCEAVLQLLQKLAQFASKFNVDACKMGRQLAAKAISGLFGDSATAGDFSKQECGTAKTSDGSESSFLDSLNNACKTLDEGFGAVAEKLGFGEILKKTGLTSTPNKDGTGENKVADGKTVEEAKEAENKLGSVNITWRLLGTSSENAVNSSRIGNLTYAEKTLILNMVGTVIKNVAAAVADPKAVTGVGKSAPVATTTPTTPSTPTTPTTPTTP